MRPHGSPAELEHRRLRALEFLNQGLEPQTRAKERNDQRIRQWIRQEWSRAKKNSPISGPA